MSYARFGPDSDVYVYLDAATGALHCCGCSIVRPRPRSGDDREHLCFYAETPDHMVDHLTGHVDAGELVPDETLRKLVLESDDGVFRG